jgi:hypothetical protein
MRLLRKPQNFLKHADRDHNEVLDDLSTKQVALLISFAIKNFVLLEKRWSPAMVTFFFWLTAANPDLVKPDATKDQDFLELAAKMRKDFPDLYSEQAFQMIYESLRINAPYLFSPKRF